MATQLDEIVDYFMTLQQDYRLLNLYNASGSTVFNTYIEGWLLQSIVEFTPICNQVLNYSTGSQVFSLDLSLENKLILAQMTIKYWLMKNIQDILQMTNSLQDHDFKTFSQAQNLKAKQDYYNSKKEEISQLLVEYSYRNNPWSNWFSQSFSGGI